MATIKGKNCMRGRAVLWVWRRGGSSESCIQLCNRLLSFPV